MEPGEVVLAWFETDLDASLYYERGLVVLTGGRLLAAERGGEQWQAWPLEAGTSLRNVEKGSAGALELLGSDGRLARWQYTVGRSAAARRLVQHLTDFRAKGAAASVAFCPSCG